MKTVCITGSSSGIGKAAAEFFLKRGWQVVATVRKEKDATLSAPRDNRLIQPILDVTKPKTVTSAIDFTLHTFGHIDVLVNNAGYGLLGPFDGASEEQIHTQFETNLMGVIRMTRAVIPTMKKQGSGVIINLSSVSGRIGFPYYSYYNTTKFAIEGLSESLYHELSPLGIHVKLIEPGPIDTDFFTRSAVYTHGKDVITKRRVSHFFGRMKKQNNRYILPPDSVARRIYQAATDQSARLRYPAGPVATMVMNARSLLPDWIVLRVVGKFNR